MKAIQFSKHALEQMAERGADEGQVIETIQTGEPVPAKKGRQGFRKNFQYDPSGADALTLFNRYW